MRRIYLILFVPSIAWAQSVAPYSAPATIGKPHYCGDQYPVEALRIGQQGRTTLSFHVTTQGTVSDIRVAESSGSVALDQASVSCAMAWQYRPAMKNGEPVEVPWKAMVDWTLFRDRPLWDLSLTSERCARVPPLTSAQVEAMHGPTVLTITLQQGKPTGFTVLKSSGSAELDTLAYNCFDRGEFRDGDGKPLSGTKNAAVLWQKPQHP